MSHTQMSHVTHTRVVLSTNESYYVHISRVTHITHPPTPTPTHHSHTNPHTSIFNYSPLPPPRTHTHLEKSKRKIQKHQPLRNRVLLYFYPPHSPLFEAPNSMYQGLTTRRRTSLVCVRACVCVTPLIHVARWCVCVGVVCVCVCVCVCVGQVLDG